MRIFFSDLNLKSNEKMLSIDYAIIFKNLNHHSTLQVFKKLSIYLIENEIILVKKNVDYQTVFWNIFNFAKPI